MFHVGYSPTNYNSTFYQNKATNNNTEKKEQDKSQLPMDGSIYINEDEVPL